MHKKQKTNTYSNSIYTTSKTQKCNLWVKRYPFLGRYLLLFAELCLSEIMYLSFRSLRYRFPKCKIDQQILFVAAWNASCRRIGSMIEEYELCSSESVVEVIKKSKFVAFVSPSTTVVDAEQFIERHRDAKATHTCWAYKVGGCSRCTDDGEPSGTAGRPMLAAIEAASLINTVAVVNRYFGGVKLGTGGLARAYGGAVATCLKAASKKSIMPTIYVEITVAGEFVPQIYSLLYLNSSTISKHAENVDALGNHIFDLEISSQEFDKVKDFIYRVTKGEACVSFP